MNYDQWWRDEQARIEKAEAEAAVLAVAPAKTPAPTNVGAAASWFAAVNTAPVAGGPAQPQPFSSKPASALDAWQRAIRGEQ